MVEVRILGKLKERESGRAGVYLGRVSSAHHEGNWWALLTLVLTALGAGGVALTVC
jgi:hypothetical protein